MKNSKMAAKIRRMVEEYGSVLEVLNYHDPYSYLVAADQLAIDLGGNSAQEELLRLSYEMSCLTPNGSLEVAKKYDKRVQDILAKEVDFPLVPVTINSVGMIFSLIPSGIFVMGSPNTEVNRYEDEGPQRLVHLTNDYWMGTFEVTQEQYERVMGVNPSHFNEKQVGMDTSNFPVDSVSWDDAQKFIQKLNELPEEKAAGNTYRLPTEAEWEYACRGASASYQIFHYGNSLSSHQANFNGEYPYGNAPKGPYLRRTCEVGSYKPNRYGLFDMHGNVWEWCQDWYSADFYQKSLDELGEGPASKEETMLINRGATWIDCVDPKLDRLKNWIKDNS